MEYLPWLVGGAVVFMFLCLAASFFLSRGPAPTNPPRKPAAAAVRVASIGQPRLLHDIIKDTRAHFSALDKEATEAAEVERLARQQAGVPKATDSPSA